MDNLDCSDCVYKAMLQCFIGMFSTRRSGGPGVQLERFYQ